MKALLERKAERQYLFSCPFGFGYLFSRVFSISMHIRDLFLIERNAFVAIAVMVSVCWAIQHHVSAPLIKLPLYKGKDQSFSAPIVRPWTMDLRTKKAKTETGRTIRVAAAPIPAQSIFP